MTRTPQLRAVTATAPPPTDAGKVAPAALAPAAKALGVKVVNPLEG